MGDRKAGARLLLSAGAGLLVFGLAAVVAWLNVREPGYFSREQSSTRLLLPHLAGVAERIHARTGVYPRTLEDLARAEPRSVDAECLRDAWGRPFAYSVDSRGPLIVSYGRDGAAGGEGLDADMSSRDDIDRLRRLRATAYQYFVETPPGRRGLGICSVTGALVFVVALLTIPARELAPAGRRILVTQLAGAAVATGVVAGVIAGLLGLPKNH
jgi:general secretion pathway protein G